MKIKVVHCHFILQQLKMETVKYRFKIYLIYRTICGYNFFNTVSRPETILLQVERNDVEVYYSDGRNQISFPK